MRSSPQHFVAPHNQGLGRFVLNSEATFDFIRDIARPLYSDYANRASHLRHFTVNTRADSAHVAVLENYRGILSRLRNESIERLDVVDFDKPRARHVECILDVFRRAVSTAR